MNSSLEAAFRHHPIGCPLWALSVSGVLLAVCWQAGLLFGILLIPAVFLGIVATVSAVSLVVGFFHVGRKQAGYSRLACPHCGMTKTQMPDHLSYEEFPYENFALVTCRSCGGEFTVNHKGKIKQLLPMPAGRRR